MRKLCLVPALLLAAASASAETPVKLWNDYVYNQPVESVKAEAGIFDCSQRGQQMFCRANVEFAGHKDWGEVFFFTNGRLKAVSLFAPISRAHFTDAAAAVRKTGMTPAVLTDHEDKVAFDFFQAKLQAKSMASIDRELATKETELLKGKKVGYVFIDAKTLLESVKSGNVTNAAQFFQIHAPRTLRTTEILLDEQGVDPYGDVLTESLFAYKLEQYPDGVGSYEDFIRANWLGGRTTDCVGLIKGYGWLSPETMTIDYGAHGMPDIGANQMYYSATESGTIDTMPDIPGLAVWHDGHIGVYIGGGQVVEAMGTKYGVVKTELAGRGWTHWLKIPYINYD